jgi:hypothetical protein
MTTTTTPVQTQPSVITLTLTPTFKLVFLAVLGITVLAMILGCSLAMVGFGAKGRPDPNLTAAMQACITTWKLGFGAIIGLLGGKAM